MRAMAALLALALLAGCATTPVASVTGNGSCHPSQDLPDHKVIKKVPEQVTPLEDFWALFLQERKDHAQDVRDYNSLYNECVTSSAS